LDDTPHADIVFPISYIPPAKVYAKAFALVFA